MWKKRKKTNRAVRDRLVFVGLRKLNVVLPRWKAMPWKSKMLGQMSQDGACGLFKRAFYETHETIHTAKQRIVIQSIDRSQWSENLKAEQWQPRNAPSLHFEFYPSTQFSIISKQLTCVNKASKSSSSRILSRVQSICWQVYCKC